MLAAISLDRALYWAGLLMVIYVYRVSLSNSPDASNGLLTTPRETSGTSTGISYANV